MPTADERSAGALLVVDSSAMVALLADSGPAGEWAEGAVGRAALAAPDLLPYEVSNILRRQQLSGALDASAASLAHADITTLAVDLYPYAIVAARVWGLRDTVTAYDAAYVAVAEMLAAPLVTLHGKLARATGPRCAIISYPNAD